MRITFKKNSQIALEHVFTIQEEFRTITQANFGDSSYTEYSPMNYFEYELTTPLKAIASISANINKNLLYFLHQLQ